MIERLKSTTFWVSLISAVFLILGAFGVEIGDETASSIINSVCSALVMFGIAKPSHGSKSSETDSRQDDDVQAE